MASSIFILHLNVQKIIITAQDFWHKKLLQREHKCRSEIVYTRHRIAGEKVGNAGGW